LTTRLQPTTVNARRVLQKTTLPAAMVAARIPRGSARGDDQDDLEGRRGDQCMTVRVDLGGDAQLLDHPGSLFSVDVGHRDHTAAQQLIAETTDVFAADGASTDNTDVQSHDFCSPIEIVVT